MQHQIDWKLTNPTMYWLLTRSMQHQNIVSRFPNTPHPGAFFCTISLAFLTNLLFTSLKLQSQNNSDLLEGGQWRYIEFLNIVKRTKQRERERTCTGNEIPKEKKKLDQRKNMDENPREREAKKCMRMGLRPGVDVANIDSHTRSAGYIIESKLGDSHIFQKNAQRN